MHNRSVSPANRETGVPPACRHFQRQGVSSPTSLKPMEGTLHGWAPIAEYLSSSQAGKVGNGTMRTMGWSGTTPILAPFREAKEMTSGSAPAGDLHTTRPQIR